MTKRRLTLSLVALIGSALLLVVASFAWFAISNIGEVDTSTVNVRDVDVTAVLYESDDDVIFTEVSGENGISFENQVPGNTKYFRVDITNNNDFAVRAQMYLNGFTDTYADIGGDTANYTAGQTLMDVMLLNSSNNINSDTITDQTLISLLIASIKIVTHESVDVPASGTAELYFSITFPDTVGNDYQNLMLNIDNVYVQAAE